MSTKDVCDRFGISRTTFYRWAKIFDPNDLSTLESKPTTPKSVRQPETPNHIIDLIEQFRRQEHFLSKEKIAALLEKDHGVEISPATVGRIIQRERLYFADTPSHQLKRLRTEIEEGRSSASIGALRNDAATKMQVVLGTSNESGSTANGSLSAAFFLFATVTLSIWCGAQRVYALEGSNYQIHETFPNQAAQAPLVGSSFQVLDGELTNTQKPLTGSNFQITQGGGASVSASSASSSSTSSSSEAATGGGTGGVGGGRRSPPIFHLPTQSSSSAKGEPVLQPPTRPTFPTAPFPGTVTPSVPTLPTPAIGEQAPHEAAPSVPGAAVGTPVGSTDITTVSTPAYEHYDTDLTLPSIREDIRTDLMVLLGAALISTSAALGSSLSLSFPTVALKLPKAARALWKPRRPMPKRESKKRTKTGPTRESVIRRAVIAALLGLGLLLLLWITGASAATTSPLTHVYQGHLLDSSGDPVTTAHTIRFSYWTSTDYQLGDVTGAGAINTSADNYVGWYEEQTVTPSSDGSFSLQLGSSTALPTIDSLPASTLTSLFLQVEVKTSGADDTDYDLLDVDSSDASVDRSPVLSVPFAQNADFLDQRDTGTGSGSIPVLQSGGTLSLTGNLMLNSGGASRDTTLTFGNAILDETVKFSLANQRFEFSDDVHVEGNLTASGALTIESASRFKNDLSVLGTLSGATLHSSGLITGSGALRIEGASTLQGPVTFGSTIGLGGITYTFPSSDGSGSGRVLMTNGAGQLTWGLAGTGSLQTRTRTMHLAINTAAITVDGSNNEIDVYVGSETGSTVNPHQYYRITTDTGTLQDVDLRLKVQLPADFVSFANSGDLSFAYKNTGSDATESALDILVEDADGDDAFTAADGEGLFNTSWTTYSDEFDGGSFDPAAGEYIYVIIKGYASSDGSAFAGELVLTYTSR